MTASGLERRIAQLEEATLRPEPLLTWVQIIVHPGETVEEEQARYTAEHPETPTSVRWLIRKIVEWPRRSTT